MALELVEICLNLLHLTNSSPNVRRSVAHSFAYKECYLVPGSSTTLAQYESRIHEHTGHRPDSCSGSHLLHCLSDQMPAITDKEIKMLHRAFD